MILVILFVRCQVDALMTCFFFFVKHWKKKGEKMKKGVKKVANAMVDKTDSKFL